MRPSLAVRRQALSPLAHLAQAELTSTPPSLSSFPLAMSIPPSDPSTILTTTTTPSYILSTPAEIFDAILTHVSELHLQRTALSLLSVFPHVPVSVNHLWRHVVVGKEGQ